MSILEYTVLFVIVIGAFLIMRTYIQRGLHGSWEATGQSFAYGRQYDSQRTVECSFDAQSNLWYDRNCYQSAIVYDQCNGNQTCEENVITNGTCTSSYCCTQLDNGTCAKCAPNCSCSSSTCAGSTCSDGCGGQCPGNVGPSCSQWGPCSSQCTDNIPGIYTSCLTPVCGFVASTTTACVDNSNCPRHCGSGSCTGTPGGGDTGGPGTGPDNGGGSVGGGQGGAGGPGVS